MLRWTGLASLVGSSLIEVFLLATPSRAEERPHPNVRMSFDVGYSAPSGFHPFDRGFGLGTAWELEQTEQFGVVFRLGWERFIDDRRADHPYPYYYSPYATGFSVFNWSIGFRGYLRPHAIWRPFGEVDVGLRLVGDSDFESGLALTPRIGITWAPSGGTGLSLDSGVNFMVDQPDGTVIVPIRLGIVFR